MSPLQRRLGAAPGEPTAQQQAQEQAQAPLVPFKRNGRNHFLAWNVKPSGCHCSDALGGKNIVACRPLLGALLLSLTVGRAVSDAVVCIRARARRTEEEGPDREVGGILLK